MELIQVHKFKLIMANSKPQRVKKLGMYPPERLGSSCILLGPCASQVPGRRH